MLALSRIQGRNLWTAGVFIALLLSAWSAQAKDAELDRRLRAAVREGNPREVVRWRKAGGDVNASDDWGVTPLMLASLQGNYKIVRYLLKYGANPDRVTDKDLTALHYAARNCSFKAIAEFDRHATNPNTRNHLGQTPIMGAAEQGCAHAVRELLKWENIDLQAEDYSGKTVFDYAYETSITGEDYDSLGLLEKRTGKEYRPGGGLKLAVRRMGPAPADVPPPRSEPSGERDGEAGEDQPASVVP